MFQSVLKNYFDPAFIISRALKEDGHSIWGYVIYRCTYKDDEKWKSFMDLLRKEIEGPMEGSESRGVLEKLELTVLEDTAWEDASTAAIREHFKQWSEKAVERE
jgi:hypothetical protein